MSRARIWGWKRTQYSPPWAGKLQLQGRGLRGRFFIGLEILAYTTRGGSLHCRALWAYDCSMTASAHDVAAYILRKQGGPMSTMKLQKLVYYSQAWHLAWREDRLFDEKIEAWANGPVVYELYDRHRGEFKVREWPDGDPGRLNAAARDSVDRVVEAYGALTGRELSHLSHNEDPWNDARGDLPSTARSNAEITPESMQEFYGALDTEKAAPLVASLSTRSNIAAA